MDNKKKEQISQQTKQMIGLTLNTALSKKDKKQKELAAFLGVQDNVVSYWCKGERVPNTEQIIKIAEFFNYSSDYFLGLTDVPTPLKTDEQKALRIACDYTGLDEEAINALREKCFYYSCDKDEVEVQIREKKVLNDFIKSFVFTVIINYICEIQDEEKYAIFLLALLFKDYETANSISVINSNDKSENILQMLSTIFASNTYSLGNTFFDRKELFVFRASRIFIDYLERQSPILNILSERGNIEDIDGILCSLKLSMPIKKLTDIEEAFNSNKSIDIIKEFLKNAYQIYKEGDK